MNNSFLLVWLDEDIDEINNEYYQNCMIELRKVVNTVKTFINANECIDFVTNNENEKIYMILSEKFAQNIVPIETVQDFIQVVGVYILCQDIAQQEELMLKYTKVKGGFTDITFISEALKKDTGYYEQDSLSFTYINPDDEQSKKGLDVLDQSFMYVQLLKEMLLEIKFEEQQIEDFYTYCRTSYFKHDPIGLKKIERFVKEYDTKLPIEWYTSEDFMYPILNKALRDMDVNLIINLGFFLRHIHQNIEDLHTKWRTENNNPNLFIVYRGQRLSDADFDRLKKAEGGLTSFNNFLSTSVDEEVASMLAESSSTNTGFVGILFVISGNPSISSTCFADVTHLSVFKTEVEILFSMHSVFRIRDIKKINNNDRLWRVELTFTGEDDSQLRALTECIREETSSKYNGWHRLGKLLIRLGHYNKAEELYQILLKKAFTEGEKGHIIHNMGLTKHLQGKHGEAIKLYDQASQIFHLVYGSNHPSTATYYCNIGSLYSDVGDYSKAFFYHGEALAIRKESLLSNDPDLAVSYNKIGKLYYETADYPKALDSYKHALEIRKKSVHPDHPFMAISYNNFGLVYTKMGKFSEALLNHREALKIRLKSLPKDHPEIAESYENIGSVYYNQKNYSEALLNHEKAYDIRQKSLSKDHLSLGNSYNNIGLVYSETGKNSEAILNLEKALEIFKKCLPQNHPSMATVCSNIGSAYFRMKQYSKAMSNYQDALKIFKKSFSKYHPSTAVCYKNIGTTYDQLNDYSNAMLNYKDALNIFQQCCPADHFYIINLKKAMDDITKRP
jgi:tetratricopeptide (TPR) repeat protein